MNGDQPLRIWNRSEGRYDEEKVFGGGFLKWAYTTPLGSFCLDKVLVHPVVSRFYGWLQDRPMTSEKLEQFNRTYGIKTKDYEPGPYRTFNDYFIRKFQPGARAFDSVPGHLPAFAEGRYFAFEKFAREIRVAVKGFRLDLGALLQKPSWFTTFENGPCLIARLAPVDYHRFHFPDSGRVLDSWRVGGRLDSVHPLALGSRPNILFENERHITIIESENFGKLALIDVGALCVGKIVQSHSEKFNRGDEKGYFLFGGSTVILLGEPGSFVPDQVLLEQTSLGFETFIRLGEKLGSRPL